MKKNRRVVIRNKDIYDEFGRAYIKKGSTIVLNEHNINTLIKLGILDAVLEELDFGKENYKNDIKKKQREKKMTQLQLNTLKKIEHKFLSSHEVVDNDLFELSSKETLSVLENMKGEPWYIYVNTLANYAEWYYSHSLNTAIISTMIGVKLGYRGIKLENIITGAILHDIGMLLIPKEIINKKGPLSESEMAIQKKHCELGISMIDDLDIPKVSRNIIMQHHERTDGSGYPLGLKSIDINEESQIVMIADSFDAATSVRPYRQAKDTNSVITEIITMNDKYSKNVIDCFTDVISLSKY